MSERAPDDRRRPWHRGLLGDRLTEVPVTTPDGSAYLVRLRRSSRIVAPSLSGDAVSAAVDFVKKNVKARGTTGWDVVVVRPATRLRAERTMFTQHVSAKAIVVDVTMAVYDALGRGDRLWDEE